ncbi:hypothetical protein BDY21DRAFT_350278 [Lineolata rhizophorae]|uniref:Uncharacterized protein n=1 Tax=Lineolata rhizophorae TaxID=578093 RepID=A0A6A6NUT6_9PEZI|nr:hypothetical protein BDY21DRAFT_350278 [Lineolata rhizophorae]
MPVMAPLRAPSPCPRRSLSLQPPHTHLPTPVIPPSRLVSPPPPESTCNRVRHVLTLQAQNSVPSQIAPTQNRHGPSGTSNPPAGYTGNVGTILLGVGARPGPDKLLPRETPCGRLFSTTTNRSPSPPSAANLVALGIGEKEEGLGPPPLRSLFAPRAREAGVLSWPPHYWHQPTTWRVRVPNWAGTLASQRRPSAATRDIAASG